MDTVLDIESLETGDLILFNGQGFWFSYIVEYFTWSNFSHIGMVLRDPTYLDPKLKGLYMIESGTENFPDAIEHRLHYGVQVVNLHKVVDSYKGRAWVRKLKINSSQRKEIEEKLPTIWDEIKDLPYDDRIWDLMRTNFRLDWGNMHRVDKFFCSALIAFLYEKFNYLKIPMDWDLIEPKDFDKDNKIDPLLVEDVELGSMVQIL